MARRFLGFCDEVEQLLGRKVDVLTEGALHRELHERIRREARPL